VAVGGGALALDAFWLFAAFLVLVVLAATALATRRFLLERGGGTVECGLRPAGHGAWRLGVASYQGDELCWYDALGVLLRAEHVLHRRSLTVLSRRPSLPSEAATLGPQRVVIEVWTQQAAESSDEHVELAMTEEALTGFLAWLEASPPGSHLHDIA
jgi:hypothetical protein